MNANARFRYLMSSALASGCLLILASAAHAQVPAGGLLVQISNAFSSGKNIQQVVLTGSAEWFAGSLQDSGSVRLSTSAGGTWEMQLNLATSGQRTETQSAIGLNAACQWSNGNGVLVDSSLANCTGPSPWFLPNFFSNSTAPGSDFLFADLGVTMIGSSGSQYRHLRSYLNCTSLPSAFSAGILGTDVVDLGLDTGTFLPAVVSYTFRPDDGSQNSIRIQVRYSNYQSVNGVQIPFSIRRYVNDSLQLYIQVSSVEIR